MKKLLTLFLAMAMLFSMMSFASAEEPFELRIMVPQFPSTIDFDLENNPILDKIEELTGVRLKIEWAVNSEYETLFNAMLTDNNPPAVAIAQNARGATVISSARKGAFYDLTEYVNDPENYPYLAMGNQVVYNNISIDGRVYGIYRTRDYPRGGAYYRTDIAKAAGFDKEELTTVADLTELAEKLAAYSPDTYALNMCEYTEGTINYITCLLGAPNTWGINEEGNVYPAHEHPAYLEGLKWLKNLFDKGGIDPNFITTPSGSWNDAERNGVAFMRFDCLDNAHRQQEWFETNKGVTDTIWMSIGPLAKEDGTITQWAQSLGFNGEVLVNKKGLAEEDLPKVMKFLDWCNSPDGQTLLNAGIEGLTYWVDADGYRITKNEETGETLEENIGKYLNNLNQIHMGVSGNLVTPAVKQTALRQRYAELNQILTPYAVNNPCYPFDSQTYVSYGTQLAKLLTDAAAMYIAGSIDEEGLKAYWQQWADEGGAQMTQEYNEAYHASIK